jgi:hypothetical protein
MVLAEVYILFLKACHYPLFLVSQSSTVNNANISLLHFIAKFLYVSSVTNSEVQ